MKTMNVACLLCGQVWAETVRVVSWNGFEAAAARARIAHECLEAL